MKALQKFTPEYLEICKSMTTDQIVQFLEDFRLLHGERALSGKSKLISVKVSQPLLNVFKLRCKQLNIPYQTQIKTLMAEWLSG